MKLCGYDVKFPYEPYGIQKVYMSRLLACLKNKDHGLLESPTGSGKTLSILCASTAWLDDAQDKYINQRANKKPETNHQGKRPTRTPPQNVQETRTAPPTTFGPISDDPLADILGAQPSNSIVIKPERPSSFSKPSLLKPIDNTQVIDLSDEESCNVIIHSRPATIIKKEPTTDFFGESENFLDNAKILQDPVELDDLVGNPKAEEAEMKQSKYIRGPRLIYSSRTHMQLNQAMQELKRTEPNKKHRAVILASRDQLCIHPEVSRLNGSEMNLACNVKVKKNACPFYQSPAARERVINGAVDVPNILDIEDLVDFGHKNMTCPYFAARELNKRSDIIFAPYNMILEPGVRKANDISLTDAAVVFDEGHNIEQFCEESSSSELRSATIDMCVKELFSRAKTLDQLDNRQDDEEMKNAGRQITSMEVKEFAELLDGLGKDIADECLNKKQPHYPTMTWFKQKMEKCCFNLKVATNLVTLIDDLCEQHQISGYKTYMINFYYEIKNFLKNVYPLAESKVEIDEANDTSFNKDFMTKFRVSFDMERRPVTKQHGKEEPGGEAKKQQWILKLYCLSPSIAMNNLIQNRVHSIVITSGTLSPLSSYSTEMAIPFKVTLENNHVIGPEQLKVCAIPSHEHTVLNSSYKNRDNPAYYHALGKALIDYMKIVPDGMFLFFTSYANKEKCFNEWHRTNLIKRIRECKEFFEEAKGKSSFNESIERFKEYLDLNPGQGAVFVGVCRGKLSEGLDLGNHYCRSVAVVGLPYPAKFESRVALKEQYLSEKNLPDLTPKLWYELQMKRALNQAIGRVIRHKNDFGTVLLLDERFTYDSTLNGLSKWVKPFIINKEPEDTKHIINQLYKKFENVPRPLPKPSSQALDSKPSSQTLVGKPSSQTKSRSALQGKQAGLFHKALGMARRSSQGSSSSQEMQPRSKSEQPFVKSVRYGKPKVQQSAVFVNDFFISNTAANIAKRKHTHLPEISGTFKKRFGNSYE